MKINNDCSLVLSSLFCYDFSACAYNILQSIDWDLTNIDFNDKQKRSVQIGLLQRDNPQLSRFINETMLRLVDHYININHIDERKIIVRTKDGCISEEKFKITNDTMPIDLRNIISKMIITLDRKQFLAIHTGGDIEIKGVKNKPKDVTFFNLFRKLDFSSKKSLLLGLEYIRKSIMHSDNVSWFVQLNEEDNTYNVPIIGEGIIKLNRSAINLIDHEEIDKSFVWEEYIWPFAESLLVHCHSKKE